METGKLPAAARLTRVTFSAQTFAQSAVSHQENTGTVYPFRLVSNFKFNFGHTTIWLTGWLQSLGPAEPTAFTSIL